MTLDLLTKREPELSWRRLRLGAALLLLGLGFGCRTADPSRFASITVQDRSIEEIRQAATAVFVEDGFAAAPTKGLEMIFEKESSRLNQVVWGSLLDGRGLWMRVHVIITTLGVDSYRVDAQAYLVEHRGDRVFEEEQPLRRSRRHAYQNMLDEVRRRL